MKIAIGAPIRDRAWALPSWLEHLDRAISRAEMAGHSVRCIFLENDSVDGTPDLLSDYALAAKDRGRAVKIIKYDFGYAHYKVPYGDRARGLSDGELPNPQNDKCELALMRNMIVEEFLAEEGRHLIMWDSDVWMPSEAMSGDLRSLVSVMQWRRDIGTMCADTQHPSCRGLFHNALVRVRGGLYNHPNRKILPSDRIMSMWVADAGVGRRFAQTTPSMPWDQRARSLEIGSSEVLYLARVETTGGGGAAITQREAFLPPVNARFGANVQGEDVPLCERLAKSKLGVALYSGIRGLHLTRDLFEKAGGVFDLNPNGEWVEEWRSRISAERCEDAVGSAKT